MTESAEWKVKGDIISYEKGAKKFCVDTSVIDKGINALQIETRKVTSTSGMQRIYVLQSQLMRWIRAEQYGALHLDRMQQQAELTRINRDITTFKKYLEESQEKKLELEKWLSANPMPR